MNEERFPLSYTLKSGRTIALTRAEAAELLALLSIAPPLEVVHTYPPTSISIAPASTPPSWYIGDDIRGKFSPA